MALSSARLKKLRSRLPRGYQTLIASQVGHSRSYVGHVANGHRYNKAIMLELIRVARMEAHERESMNLAIDKL